MQLAGCAHLTEVKLGYASLTIAGVQALVKALPRLTSLELLYCSTLPPLSDLAAATQLRKLEIQQHQPLTLAHVAALSEVRSLRVLYLADTRCSELN